MERKESKEQTWYVAFKDSKQRWPLKWLTKKGFRHCFMFAQFGDDVIEINPAYGFMQVVLYKDLSSSEYAVDLIKNNNHKVLIVTSTQPDRYIPRFGVNCVSVIKYVLGIKTFAITPKALYNSLLNKNNAIEVML